MSILSEISSWCSTLELKDIPSRVVDKVRHQILSNLAAMLAGLESQIGKKIARAIPGNGGNYWSFQGGRCYSLEKSLFLNCSFAMIHDYDDYLFAGHTGHSAVIPSLLLGDHEGKRLSEILPAMVAANEVGGRLGAATPGPPQRGQQMSYIHLAGGAIVASRILGLGKDATSDAISIALYQPVLPLYPGFYGAESKVTTASTPTLIGVQSALLAREGLKGNPDILDGPRGFLQQVSHVPMPFFLTGWGHTWVSDALAYKIYPGCAYIDTALDAWGEIRDQIDSEGKTLHTKDIKEVLIEANGTTVGMEERSKSDRPNPLCPINITFSAINSLAIAILAKRLTPGSLEPDYLEKNREEILDLASKIQLIHNENYDTVPSDEETDLDRAYEGSTRRIMRNQSQGEKSDSGFDLSSLDFNNCSMRWPAKVTLSLHGGKEYTSSVCKVPLGAGTTYANKVPQKWFQESIHVLGEDKANKVAHLILREDPFVGEVLDLLTISS